MAEAKTTQPVNKAAGGGDHDRVAMLSLKSDGSPDQHDPEFIGDKEAAVAATTEQFRQQAVSAADIEVRGATTAPADTSDVEDPTVEELIKAHEAAAKPAAAQAEKVVASLHKGAGDQ